MDTDPNTKTIRVRIEDLSREIGTLLVAFTPLDSVLWRDRQDRAEIELTFFLVALLLILLAFLSESRRARG